MTWVRLDDQFPIHRKVSALSDAAFRLHVEAICWCARNLTDGRIEHDDLPSVSRIRRADRYVTELLAHGLWTEANGGWVVGDVPAWRLQRSGFRQKIPDAVRLAVYERDGWRCLECGNVRDLTLDHVHPWSQFGADQMDNLRTLCQSCNSSKGARV